jgi:hypothetical protein
MAPIFASALLMLAQAAQPAAPASEAPIATASRPSETPEQVRMREAIAYFYELPKSAPSDDYALVGWCAGRVAGHVELGASLPDADAQLLQLARGELSDFTESLRAGARFQSAEAIRAKDIAYRESYEWWRPILNSTDARVRSQAFDTFFGIPGRCEHAARRIRENITTPPATLTEVGLHAEPADAPAKAAPASPQ